MDLLYYTMYGVILLWLGFRNWELATQVEELQEQMETNSELIVSMAKELSELGSPNVSIVPNSSYQIKYGTKE